MLYPSASNVSFDHLKTIKIPDRKKETSYWEGVKHVDLVHTVRKVAKQHKLKITDEQFQTGNKGDTLFASWDFDKRVPGKGDEMRMSLGYRGSNMGRYAHTFATGARVVVCQNGMIAGEFSVKRKHTTTVELLPLVERAFDQYLKDVSLIRPLMDRLKAREIDNEQAAELMLESARRGIIGWSRIRIVDEHWNHPQHEQFVEDNAWTLYNAFTQSAKVTMPIHQMEIMRDIPKLLLTHALD